MNSTIRASRDEKLAARIVDRSPLIYADSDAADSDRPAHVRAASSLAPFREACRKADVRSLFRRRPRHVSTGGMAAS